MSHVEQSRHYAEERDAPPQKAQYPLEILTAFEGQRVSSHSLGAGCSEGGFETLAGGSARRPREGLVGVGYLPRQCSG